MGLIHIMERGGKKAERFEDAMYEIKEAVDEMCDIYDEMKEQFSSRDGGRASYRGGYNRRDNEEMEWSERRGGMGYRRRGSSY